jgi:hypothetical protein
MRYLTVIIIHFFIITFLTYGDIWLFELKNSNFCVLYLESYLHLSHLSHEQAFNSNPVFQIDAHVHHHFECQYLLK